MDIHEPIPAIDPNVICQAHWEQGVLRLENALFRETWTAVKEGGLRLTSFQRALGPEWVSPEAPARPGPEADPLSSPAPRPSQGAPWEAAFSTRRVRRPGLPGTILVVTLRFSSSVAGIWREHEFQLHADVAGSVHRILDPLIEATLNDPGAPPARDTDPARLLGAMRIKPNGQMFATLPELAHPLFALAARHLRIRSVAFVDQTDHHSNLVFEREWLTHPGERCLPLQTNLVCIEDPASPAGEGFLCLLLAPLHTVRASWVAYYDFLFAFQSGRLVASACPAGYRLARIAYSGGRLGATLALQAVQRVFYQAAPPRPAMVLSNTWGDRAGAGHLSEAFVLEEIAAARDLGVEIVQIDDGWQKGATVNTTAAGGVWNGFWAADPEFWTPHPIRFPHGLAPLVAAARSANVHLGLWYAPDSTDDLANWERDAAQILMLWRDHGIEFFKLDAVKLHTRLAETRFHALCDRVLGESAGAVSFDFDATAEHRPTYWGRPGGGALFLENRFTEQAGYHPHQTLRALWSLAHFVRAERIRVEFLNPTRNEADYGDDPLRPSAYPAEYLFAVTMAASPLAWFEVCRIPAAIAARWRPLIARWKEHRAAFHRGDVVPVGHAPDGYSWTGFVSLNRDAAAHAGEPVLYALIFRETTAEISHAFVLPRLPSVSASGEGRVLAGEGTAVVSSDGRMTACIPSARRFLFVAWYC